VKRITVLGSTGSIGESTLSVLRAMPDRFQVVALACNRRTDRIAAQMEEFSPGAVAVADPSRASSFAAARGCRMYAGPHGVLDMLADVPADIVVNGISGSAGLLPSVAALRAGSDLALANKETIVMAGSLVLAEAEACSRRVLPVDSEHAALSSLLSRVNREEVAELILTASGGAFRDLPIERLEHVRLGDALRHPTWKMGRKITVDCATMANKGLEVIEAHQLFKLPTSRIKVLIHPQSQVHSLLRTVDGTLHAELSSPDMRIPIQNALTWPEVVPSPVPWLEPGCLTFFPVDHERYRMLDLAYAASAGAALSIVFNAANEFAVSRFIEDAIPFAAIPSVVEEALSLGWTERCDSIESVLAVDAEARCRTGELMKGMMQWC
jgi:1-deoxy-D-xylulose-5-phosphate reductoisomerase